MWLIVIFFDGADNPCRCSHSYGIGWDVLGYHSAGAYDGTVSDGDARENGHVAAYPDIVADGNRLRPGIVFPS